MNLPQHNDREWLQALAMGDARATQRLYASQRKPIISWICRRGGDEHDAEDVFQEAMVVLFEKAQQESFRLSCTISTYLFAISKYIWYKKLQQKSNRKTTFAEEKELEIELASGQVYPMDVAAHWEREAQYGRMADAMESLGSPCNQLLKAFYLEQKSMKDIAEEFGYTNPDNAKTQKYKCLNRLKKLFAEAKNKT